MILILPGVVKALVTKTDTCIYEGLVSQLDSRRRLILEILLETEDKITAEQISAATGLSKRVVRYNMGMIATWLSAFSMKLIRKPGFGFRIVGNLQKRAEILKRIKTPRYENILLTPHQRIRAELIKVITASAPLSMSKLAEGLDVSRSTIVRDLGSLDSWLRNHKLSLIRKRNVGVKVIGEEAAIRFALVGLIKEELVDFKQCILSIPYPKVKSNKVVPQTIIINIEKLNRFFKKPDTFRDASIRAALQEYCKNPYLIIYIAVTIDRLQRQEQIQLVPTNDITQLPQFSLADNLYKRLQEEVGIVFNKIETQLLGALFLCLDIRNHWVMLADVLQEKYIPEIVPVARELMKMLALSLHPMLQIDQELLDNIVRFLYQLKIRTDYSIPITCPYIKEVDRYYSDIQKIVYKALSASVLPRRIIKTNQFHAEEVGILTLYVVAALDRILSKRKSKIRANVLGDGFSSSSSLIVSRLFYEFPSIEVVECVAPEQIHDIEKSNPDVVFSLMPITATGVQTPIIKVSPFLVEDEVIAIRSWIRSREEIAHSLSTSILPKASLMDLLNHSNIQIIACEQDWQDAVRLACDPLIASNNINNQYVESIITLIRTYGVYMAISRNAVLLHASPSDGVKELGVALLVNKAGINFGDNNPINLVFVLSAVDKHSHLIALGEIVSLVKNDKIVRKILTSQTGAEVLNIIKRQMIVEQC